MFSTNAFAILIADTDVDTLPDWWETAMGLDPNDATGINGDTGEPDGDGLNNRHEYLSGNNPFVADTDADGAGDYDEDADAVGGRVL